MTGDSAEHYYVGADDCKKVTCQHKQEFPRSDDPHCIVHSLENWVQKNRSVAPGHERSKRGDGQ